MTTSLYFELEHLDRYHRADWEDRLAGWLDGCGGQIKRCLKPDDAEFILEPNSLHSFIGGRAFRVAPKSHYRRRPESTFTWDPGDHPTGRLPGLYCSLSRRLSSPARHRGFCYPLRINRLVSECPQSEARFLFGFSGNITSPLRARLFTTLSDAAAAGRALLRQTESIFMRIYDPATDQERARFVDDLRLCRFILCPRGNGLSSIRLFETMEADRVPVIISDALHLPDCVDWLACSIRIPERELAHIPELLSDREAEWPRLAAKARSEWERCFGDENLLPVMVGELRSILAVRGRPESMQQYFFPWQILPDYSVVCAKSLRRRLQALRHR